VRGRGRHYEAIHAGGGAGRPARRKKDELGNREEKGDCCNYWKGGWEKGGGGLEACKVIVKKMER